MAKKKLGYPSMFTIVLFLTLASVISWGVYQDKARKQSTENSTAAPTHTPTPYPLPDKITIRELLDNRSLAWSTKKRTYIDAVSVIRRYKEGLDISKYGLVITAPRTGVAKGDWQNNKKSIVAMRPPVGGFEKIASGLVIEATGDMHICQINDFGDIPLVIAKEYRPIDAIDMYPFGLSVYFWHKECTECRPAENGGATNPTYILHNNLLENLFEGLWKCIDAL